MPFGLFLEGVLIDVAVNSGDEIEILRWKGDNSTPPPNEHPFFRTSFTVISTDNGAEIETMPVASWLSRNNARINSAGERTSLDLGLGYVVKPLTYDEAQNLSIQMLQIRSRK